MKNNLRKTLFILLCLLLSLSILISCTEDAELSEENTDSVNNTDSTTVGEQAEKNEEHTHSFGDWLISKMATCTEEGTRVRYCSQCHESETEIIPMQSHLFINDQCSRCGLILKETPGLQFNLKNDNTYETTGYTGTNEDVIITSKHKGLAVTSISSSAFRGQNINSIYIPDSVTSIGDYAFKSCNNLTSITIGSGVTSIGGSAFYGCSSLTSITIPDSVTSIGSDAFDGCSNLTSVYYTGDISSWCGISFYNYVANPLGYAHNLYINNTLVTEITIPDTVAVIKGRTFCGWNGTSVTIPDGVTSIGDSAFRNCSSLTSVTIPDSVTRIGESAFSGCSGLTSVTIGSGVTSIWTFSFEYCSSLTSVYYTGDIVSWCGISFGNSSANPLYYAHNLYINNTLVTETTIPDTVTKIKSYAFRGWNGTSITIPDSVTSIGWDAFGGCSGLTSITIPDSVTSIGSYAFEDCYNLTSVTIGSGVTSIGSDAFYYCYKLVEVYNKSSLNIAKNSSAYGYVGYYAKNVYIQKGDSKLSTDENGYILYTDGDNISLISYTGMDTELTLPNGIIEINKYAFYENRTITSIVIPDSVTSIEDSAFYSCRSLTSVTIGNGVKSIGVDAFYPGKDMWYNTISSNLTSVYISQIAFWCGISFDSAPDNPLYYAHNLYINNTLVTEITIPDTVTEIKKYAFYGCSNLTSVAIGNGVTSIGSSAFRSCSGLTSITISDTVTSIGSYAFEDCSSLTSVTIPDSVMSIGDRAFYGCSSLSSTTIGNGLRSIGAEAFYPGTNSSGNSKSSNLTGVYYTGDIASWCGISFSYNSYAFNSNPLIYAHNLYINNMLVTEITIPDTVTEIKSNTFSGWNGTSITIPDSVTSIGDYAFYECSSLTSITIGSGVESIRYRAFQYCYKLVEVYNKSSLNITIGSSDYGHVGCYAKNVYTQKGDSKLSTDKNGYILYTDEDDISLIGYIGTDTELTLPDGITEIYQYAFYNNRTITSITIPDNVTSIGYDAFSNCSSLTSVTIGNGVKSIGNYAFSGRSLASVYYTGDIASWCGISFDSAYANPLYYAHNLYINNTLVTEITIPDSVTSIGHYAFSDCSSLTSVTIGGGVTSIGRSAFSGCSNLTSITIPDSVTSIGSYAFYNCSNLQYNEYDNRYYLGNEIHPYIVLIEVKDKSITSFDIADTTKAIYDTAFLDCSKLTSIIIPDSVTSIGYDAFYNCSSLTSVYYTGDIASWCGISFGGSGANPLYYAHNLYINNTLVTEITIPDSVTEIKVRAFEGWNGTSITIPDSVTSIGERAFQFCSSLTSITFNGTKAQWNAISKGDNWDYKSGKFTIHCTDGDIS